MKNKSAQNLAYKRWEKTTDPKERAKIAKNAYNGTKRAKRIAKAAKKLSTGRPLAS